MGLARKCEKPFTLTEATRRQKEKHIEIAWQRRKTAQDISRNCKIAALMVRKDETDLLHQISCRIQHELNQGLHEGLTLYGYSRRNHPVNSRADLYRRDRCLTN